MATFGHLIHILRPIKLTIANYWNKILGSVKKVNTVVAFKTNLEHYKMETIASGVSSQGYFWDLIEIILSKINDRSHD